METGPPTSPLTHQLRERIADAGGIPFRDFMEAALYSPEHGYYTSGRARIGRKGDFFTSVSVGAAFGGLLARQFEEIATRLADGAGQGRFRVVEQGAHDGQLAADILAAARDDFPALYARLEYVIVAPDAFGARAPHEALREHDAKVRWVGSLAELPAEDGVVFGNELLDAFPVHRVRRVGGEWREGFVVGSAGGGAFTWDWRPVSSPRLAEELPRLPSALPDGAIVELNPDAVDWVREAARALDRGAVVIVDYGFETREEAAVPREEGTLRAYAGHRPAVDPLDNPGLADLTAHVDFPRLIEEGLAAGLDALGFDDQHHFLTNVALPWLRAIESGAASAPPPAQMQTFLRQFKTLTHPGIMGRAFKVLALGKGIPPEPPLNGFRRPGIP